jgi:hypothetical protein
MGLPKERDTNASARRKRIFRHWELFFFGWELGFDVHVTELAGFEDFAALQTLDVFRVFVSRDHLDSGMPTLIVHVVARGIGVVCINWLAGAHKKSLKR